MKKIHYILLIILVIVGLVRLVYEYRAHKDELFAVVTGNYLNPSTNNYKENIMQKERNHFRSNFFIILIP